MRLLFLLLGLFFGTSKSFATEWLTFYIYVQTEYSQGIWNGEEAFTDNNYNYLEARQHEGLFGYGPESNTVVIDSIFLKLKQEDPDRINFGYKLSSSADYDTVMITTNTRIQDFDAVKNELIASYLLNSFAAVRITQPGSSKIYGLKDISVPYMDLRKPGGFDNVDTEVVTKTDTVYKEIAASANPKTSSGMSVGLVLSIIANILLLAFLVLQRRTRQAV